MAKQKAFSAPRHRKCKSFITADAHRTHGDIVRIKVERGKQRLIISLTSVPSYKVKLYRKVIGIQ